MTQPNATTIRFRKFGRSWQPVLENAADLQAALSLDPAHWAATGAPIKTLHCDELLLKLLTDENSGRLTLKTLTDAGRWLFELLDDQTGITAGTDQLTQQMIRQDHPDAETICTLLNQLAEQSPDDIESADPAPVTLEQVRRRRTELENKPISGVGIVLPDAADDPAIRRFIKDIIQTVGAAEHPSGAPGVDADKLQLFLNESASYLQWLEQGQDPAIMPLGDQTAPASEIADLLEDRIHSYFTQCRALRFDPAIGNKLTPAVAGEFPETPPDDAGLQQWLQRCPIATIQPDPSLGLDDQLNPAFADAVGQLFDQVVRPILGQQVDRFDDRQWQQIRKTLAPYRQWADAKPEHAPEAIDTQQLQTYQDPKYHQAVADLLAQAQASVIALDSVLLLEKLMLYQANLLNLSRNFISLRQLYEDGCNPLFNEGQLIMDGRRFALALRVDNRKEHEPLAKAGRIFTMYVELIAPDNTIKYEVAVPVVNGSRSNLSIGKHGTFEHVDGRNWHAKVLQIIDAPISLPEAVRAPFARLGDAITSKLDQITQASEKQLDTAGGSMVGDVHSRTVKTGTDNLAATATTPAASDKPTTASTPSPATTGTAGATSQGPWLSGTLIGGGIAIAAVGSSLAYIFQSLAALQWWQILIGLMAAILVVLIPSIILAWIRLRRRDLSGLLEGSGWAINDRIRLTRPQRRQLTFVPPYPDDARFIRTPGLIRRLFANDNNSNTSE